MNVRVILQGVSPLLMHNPRMVDPDYDLNRQIKAITSKRKKTSEDLKEIERLEWYGGLYESNGEAPKRVIQPTSKIRKCLIEAAKITKQGKSVERCFIPSSLDVPLLYEGPKEIDKLFANPRYHSRLSVGIGDKRVMRVRPSFLPWALEVPAFFVEGAGLNTDEFESIVLLAGRTTGVGDGRSIGYGRFEGKVVWS